MYNEELAYNENKDLWFEIAAQEKWKERRKVMEAIKAIGFGRRWDIYRLTRQYNYMFAVQKDSEGNLTRDSSKQKESVHFHYHVKRMMKDGLVAQYSQNWSNRKEYEVRNQPVILAQFNVASEAGKSHKKRTRRKAAEVRLWTGHDDTPEINSVEELVEFYNNSSNYWTSAEVWVDGQRVGRIDYDRWRDRPIQFTPDEYEGYNRWTKIKFYTTPENFWKAARQRKILIENRSRY